MNSGARKLALTPTERANGRLLGGLMISLALHGVIFLLQFGVPGLGSPGSAPPLTVSLSSPAPANEPLPPAPISDRPPAPPVVTPQLPSLPPTPVSPTRSKAFQMIDPVVAPAPMAALPPARAKKAVRKGPPRKARRISPPMPAQGLVDDAARVIAQDAAVNDFVVPLARPEEAEQKTVDIKQAQVGEVVGDADDSAALEAEAAKAGRIKAEEEAAAARLSEAAAREEKERTDDAAKKEEQRVAQLENTVREQAQKQQAEVIRAKAQQMADQQRLEQQRAEQQRAEQQRAEQQRAERQSAEQQKVQVQQQLLERETARLREQQEAQQRAEQQRAEQQRAEQQRAEQQRAEQQRAEQQRAEQQRAADAAAQRGRDLAGSSPGNQPGSAGGARQGGGAGGAPGGIKIPKDMLGSDLGSRARDLVKGLDLLKGSPPPARVPGDRRVATGASERDLVLKMYAESWRGKIERNGQINYPRSWADEVRTEPLVSVALRSDGSVDDVTIIISSGRPEMDEAVRRIVRVNARYAPFPPAIAQRYDVIEIRRVWSFGDTLKLMEEVR